MTTCPELRRFRSLAITTPMIYSGHAISKDRSRIHLCQATTENGDTFRLRSARLILFLLHSTTLEPGDGWFASEA